MNKRIFIGIPILQPIQTSLSVYCQSIAQDSLRFTKPENYHITISFFGEQGEANIGKIDEAIETVIQHAQPFFLQFQEIAFAPPKREPSMIWAQYQINDQFTSLVRSIENAVKPIVHFTDQRNGHVPLPHITLARFKTPQATQLPQITLDTIFVDSITLFESRQTENGPNYNILQEFPLQ